MSVCYRHPDRETGVSCSNCGNPICPDCMTTTPVGMRCPDCAAQKTQVHTMRTMTADPVVTYVLIAINVLAYFGYSSADINPYGEYGIFGYALHVDHEYWRLITSGFVHDGMAHLFLNMFGLFWLGQVLEPDLGRRRFIALYFASLLAGSAGAMILEVDNAAAGASGAIWGLLGAALMFNLRRGISPMQTFLGPVLLLNLAITFFPGMNISKGGHLGGLLGGVLAALAIDALRRRRRGDLLGTVACAGIAIVAIAVAILAAGRTQFG